MDCFDSIHDVFFNVKGFEPTKSEVQYILKNLPKETIEIAEKWGYYDTEFREYVYSWIKKNI